MLPYFIELDFGDVIEELTGAGYALSNDWFAPHLAFRFPLAGELSRTRDSPHAAAGARAVARAG